MERGELFAVARSSNRKQQITGALLLTDEWFVQVLEGEEVRVRALFDHISADPRHDSVALLEAGDVARRVFSRWAMAQVSADGEADIPLIANTRGATAAAGRVTTAEQNAVLDQMRAAITVSAG